MSISSLSRRFGLIAFLAGLTLAACQNEPSSNPTTSPIGSVDRVRPDDAPQIKQLAEIGFKAMDCMYYVLPRTKQFPVYARAYSVQNELEARTFNTKERSLAYIRSLKHLSGSVWRSRNENEFPGTCDFDLAGFTPTVLP